MSDAAAPQSNSQPAKGGQFFKGLIFGLILGLIVGALAAAVFAPMMEGTGDLGKPQKPSTATPPSPANRDERPVVKPETTPSATTPPGTTPKTGTTPPATTPPAPATPPGTPK